jgi:REP element-mobilizing transposase RayT
VLAPELAYDQLRYKVSEIVIDSVKVWNYNAQSMGRVRKHLQQRLFDARDRAAVIDGRVVQRRQPRARKRRRTPGVKLGRPPKGARAGSPHKKRPALNGRDPIHVVLRVHGALGNLRKRHMYKALREATIAVAKRELNYADDGAFRIVHISIQRNHVHLLVEADSRHALSRGMQSFGISAAKHLNRALSVKSIKRGTAQFREAMANRRRGSVFPDRYHEEIITSPKQARHTLAYVLNNWRKHKEDRADFTRSWNVDPFSSGAVFDGWKEREDAVTLWPLRETYLPLVTYLPKTWLLREGWRRHGLIRFDEVPSAAQLARASGRAAAAAAVRA